MINICNNPSSFSLQPRKEMFWLASCSSPLRDVIAEVLRQKLKQRPWRHTADLLPNPLLPPQPHPTVLSYLSYQASLPREGTADCGLGSLRQLAIKEVHLGQFDGTNSPVKGPSSQASPVCAKSTKTSFNFQASLLLDKILILDSSYLKYF